MTKTRDLADLGGGFIQAGTGAVQRTVESKLQDVVSVKDFGAVGDGVTDDTAAIQKAEAAAFSLGAVLLFQPGTYLQNGSRLFRCSISGYGATIKNIIGSEQNNVEGSAVVRFSSSSNLVCAGLTVDGISRSTGFAASAGSNLTYRDCTAKNCLNAGFTAFYVTSSTYENCYASGVKYNAIGLTAADGFYVGACSDVTYFGCKAENFERIGFVSEGEGLNKSFRTRYIGCTATNANNCDRSPTEFNAGFWVENTNGSVIDSCVVTDIAGNAGQTSGRVNGIILNAVGDNEDHVTVLSNTTIGDSTGTLPIGVNASGSAGKGKIVIQDVRIKKYASGIATLGGLDTLSIADVLLVDGNYANSSTGGVVIDSSASTLNQVSVCRVKEQNPTYTNNDAGTLNVYSANADLRVTIDDCQNFVLVSRQAIAQMRATNSSINMRTSNYSMFTGGLSQIVNCQLNYVAGNGRFCLSNVPSNPIAEIANSALVGFNTEIGATNSALFISNCDLSECHLDWFPQTSSFLSLTGSRWRNLTLNASAITHNFYSATSYDRLVVSGNFFFIQDNTKVPLQQHGNGGPNSYVIVNNIYGSNAAITTFTGGTSTVTGNING